jgi:hypothetical protein
MDAEPFDEGIYGWMAVIPQRIGRGDPMGHGDRFLPRLQG